MAETTDKQQAEMPATQAAETAAQTAEVTPVATEAENGAQQASTDNQHPGPGTSTDAEQTAEVSPQQREVDEAVAGYNYIIPMLQQRMREYEPESDEDKRKRERREQSKKIIAALGDGLSALGNLYFTSQYAPNVDQSSSSQTSALWARLQRDKAEREKNQAAYYDMAMKLGDVYNRRAAEERNVRAHQAAERRADAKAQLEANKAARDEMLFPWKYQETVSNAEKAGYDRDTARVQAQYAPQQQEAQHQRTQAQTAQARAAATASYASANRSNAEAGRTNASARHFLGNEYWNEDDYMKAVFQAARDYNEAHKNDPGFTPIATEDIITTKKRDGTTLSSRRVIRKAAEVAADVERAMNKKGKKKNPMN